MVPQNLSVTAQGFPITVGAGGTGGGASPGGKLEWMEVSPSIFSTITSGGGGGGKEQIKLLPLWKYRSMVDQVEVVNIRLWMEWSFSSPGWNRKYSSS